MKSVILLFDSLNRHYLDIYEPSGIRLANFQRLAGRSVTFDSHYAGSLPCMPARRELHTGRYNFLHSPWSPLQPFDQSVFANLSNNCIYTHLSTDHFHYWENGGSCYLNQYDSFEMVRGQQGDPWKASVPTGEYADYPNRSSLRYPGDNWYHDCVNRFNIKDLEEFPIHKTFTNGLEFIKNNHSAPKWCLMIESFDPHEPFYVADEFKQYTDLLEGEIRDWPDYEWSTDEKIQAHFKQTYTNILHQCDRYLGFVLDAFDRYKLWDDTMLIVTTDHGFMLGEKNWLGKNIMPMYEEVVHLPLWIYDPRCPSRPGSRVKVLTQTVDLASTIQGFYQLPPIPFSEGYDLTSVIRGEKAERKTALFGIFGKQVGITDGRYVLLKGPADHRNGPLFTYTLMPQNMRTPFSLKELGDAILENKFKFTQNVPVLKVKAKVNIEQELLEDYLFDLEEDPKERKNLLSVPSNASVQELYSQMKLKLLAAMKDSDAPEEQFKRLGL